MENYLFVFNLTEEEVGTLSLFFVCCLSLTFIVGMIFGLSAQFTVDKFSSYFIEKFALIFKKNET